MPESTGSRGSMNTATARLVRETVYGNRKRVDWILRHVAKDDDILEIGRGTGIHALPAACEVGYRVRGIDLDAKSVAHGQELLAG